MITDSGGIRSWGRLIAKVYQVDPLVCTRCGKRMNITGFVTDKLAVANILDHLGLSTPEAEKPQAAALARRAPAGG